MEDAVRALQQQVNALTSQNAEQCTRSCRIAWSNHDRAEDACRAERLRKPPVFSGREEHFYVWTKKV